MAGQFALLAASSLSTRLPHWDDAEKIALLAPEGWREVSGSYVFVGGKIDPRQVVFVEDKPVGQVVYNKAFQQIGVKGASKDLLPNTSVSGVDYQVALAWAARRAGQDCAAQAGQARGSHSRPRAYRLSNPGGAHELFKGLSTRCVSNGSRTGVPGGTAHPTCGSRRVSTASPIPSLPCCRTRIFLHGDAAQLLQGKEQVWQYLMRCHACGAFISPKSGVCNNPRCRANGSQVYKPTGWDWPPSKLSLTAMMKKKATPRPWDWHALNTAFAEFHPEDEDWSTPQAAFDAYNRMAASVREMADLHHGLNALHIEGEFRKEMARRCRLASPEVVDDHTLKMLGYQHGFHFASLIYDHSQNVNPIASALVYWLNPAYRPKTAKVVELKALENFWNLSAEQQAQVLADEANCANSLLTLNGVTKIPTVVNKYAKYKSEAVAWAKIHQTVDDIAAGHEVHKDLEDANRCRRLRLEGTGPGLE